MQKLAVIIASTRPGRAGKPIADWFFPIAQAHPAFTSTLVDLQEVNLPFLDEPEHPRLRKYTQQHTKDWSARIEGFDAFVVVTCEYNYGYPAPLKNALDYLLHEWSNKPIGYVSYGGVAAGTRSMQQLKQVTQALNMVSVVESVNIPMFSQFMKDGAFHPPEVQEKAAKAMLDAVARLGAALAPLRKPVTPG